MCRLFGFRSVIASQVHKSLVHADNALMRQSTLHPDGWGVAYYVGGAPHLIKSVSAAIHDSLFQRVSGIVSSETVLAHLRKATQGEVSILNSHPFQFGKWVFAHNGNIRNFKSYRAELDRFLDPSLKRYILGDTDSEYIFYLLLTHLEKQGALQRVHCPFELVAQAVDDAMKELISVVGPYCTEDDGAPEETFVTFILTNGETMVAHHGGKDLYFSSHKKRCSERETCPSFSPECEDPNPTGKVTHFLAASERLAGENVWQKLKAGDLVGVDFEMQLKRR